MPTVRQEVLVFSEPEVQLTLKQRNELLVQFREYQKTKRELDALQEKLDNLKVKIAAVRDDVGVESIGLQGFKTTLVAPLRSTFNKEKFILEGGDLSIYNRSVELRPTKSYELITLPSEEE